jgi:hypothetical protein
VCVCTFSDLVSGAALTNNVLVGLSRWGGEEILYKNDKFGFPHSRSQSIKETTTRGAREGCSRIRECFADKEGNTKCGR